MKKVYLVKTTQFNKVFYTGSVDARKLAQMADQSIEVGTVQEAQRPLEKGHLMSISKYVGETHGILPSSIIVGTKDKNKLTVETEYASNGDILYYMLFPDTEDELKEYENTIDVADGQHRVFSFIDKYRNVKLKDSDNYELPVTIFITPTIPEQQEIFLTVNANQKAVSPNLLMYLQDKLNLLSKEESMYMDLIRKLNFENISPIQGRIILSAEKIPNGYKAKKLMQVFKAIKLKEQIDELVANNDTSMMLKIISIYLKGWEKYYNFNLQVIDKSIYVKFMPMYFMLELLPTFITISLNNKEDFTIDFIKQRISDLENALNLDVINGENVFNSSQAASAFGNRWIFDNYVKECSTQLLTYNRDKKNQFNPFSNI